MYFLRSGDKGGEVCAEIITDARNPATGEIRTFPTPCDVPEGWDTLETDHDQIIKGTETWSRYRNDDLGIRFEYRVAPDGYELVKGDASAVPQKSLVEYVSLFNSKELEELKVSNIPREYPPAISVFIYDNPYKYSPREWVEKENIVSGLNLATSAVSDFEISGVPAVRYFTDGLYPADVIVALNNGRIYYISGSFISKDAPIRKDFLQILQTLALY